MLNGRLRTFEVGPRGAVGASPTRNRTGRKFHSFFSARVQRALVAFRTVPTRSSRTHFLFDGRFALSRFGLGGASTSVGRVTYRVAYDRETGTSDAVGRTRVAVRTGDAAVAPSEARRRACRLSGRRDVANLLVGHAGSWTRHEGRSPRPRRLALTHEIITQPLWILSTAYQLSISCRGVVRPAARRLAGAAVFSLGVSFGAR